MVGGSTSGKTSSTGNQALRQPGSAFKPFVYMAALKEGLTSADWIMTHPSRSGAAGRGSFGRRKTTMGHTTAWSPSKRRWPLPECSDGQTRRQSRDQERCSDCADCGITSDLQPYMPLALGASDVTLLELTMPMRPLPQAENGSHILSTDRKSRQDYCRRKPAEG